jgi:hypothetical protein
MNLSKVQLLSDDVPVYAKRRGKAVDNSNRLGGWRR